MPAYYNVIVEELSDNSVTLGVWLKHPERDYFSIKKNFVLQFIVDPILQEIISKKTVAMNVTISELEDDDWFMENEEELIENVECKTVRYPVSDLSSLTHDQKIAFWKDENKIPFAQYNVTVSNANVIAHLSKGMRWESAAYEI